MRLRVVRVVALPTEVLAPVAAGVDLRDPLPVQVGLSVAGAAEGSVLGLGRPGRPRSRLVHLWGSVTCGTGKRGVMGHRLLPCDMAMTGAALLRNDRRFRRVRIVTGDAGLPGIVRHTVDLRKPGWPGRVVGVTQRTESSVPRRRRFDTERCGDVLRPRPVAHLAGHPAMIRGHAPVGNGAVAHATLLVPRVLLRMGRDGVHGGSAIVSDVPKCLGNKEIPNSHQSGDGQGENGSQTGNLLRHLPTYP